MILDYYPPEGAGVNAEIQWRMTVDSLRKRAKSPSDVAVQREVMKLLSRVSQRLKGRTRPVLLTAAETRVLVSSLRGPDRKGFEDQRLGAQVRAYLTDPKGKRADSITFVRTAKDGTWYSLLDMDTRGNVAASGGGRMDDPSAARWKVETEPANNASDGIRQPADGLPKPSR